MGMETADHSLEIDNLPNRLTIFRVILIPVVITCLYLSSNQSTLEEPTRVLMGWISGWIFVAASITDFFDGYIARKRGIVTIFGSFLDPIADKFLVVSCLIMLLSLNRLPSVVVIFLVLREMYMTSLRLLATNEGLKGVPVSQLGKWKTVFQMMGIPMLMANEQWWIFPLPTLGHIFIYLSFIVSMLSALLYSRNTIVKIKHKRDQRKKNKKQALRDDVYE